MSARDDGGMAFPLHDGQFEGALDGGSRGMTLRDYFAAKVAQAVWSNNELLVRSPKNEEARWIAAIAYEQADAMLKERAK